MSMQEEPSSPDNHASDWQIAPDETTNGVSSILFYQPVAVTSGSFITIHRLTT